MKVVCDIFPARARVIPDTPDRDEIALVSEVVSITAAVKGSRLVTATRVVVTPDTVMIAADSNTGPMLIFREKYDPGTSRIDRTGRTASRVTTLTGKVIIFDKDVNCGCGSRLRGWNPYRILEA